MRKIRKWLTLFAMAVGMVSAVPNPVFSFTDEAVQTETPPETEAATVIVEETSPETEATPFSVPGNGQLLDDMSDDDTKQFLTVQTKNGNTFFLVLDRSSNTNNAYMLSMIDENDLAEFIDEKQTEPETEKPQVVIPETEVVPQEVESEMGVEKQPENINTSTMLVVMALLAVGLGAVYYLKVVKPRKEEEDAGDEDLEFYDGGSYINEDQQENPRDTEK